jgi:hypothetical protein
MGGLRAVPILTMTAKNIRILKPAAEGAIPFPRKKEYGCLPELEDPLRFELREFQAIP